MRFLLTSTVSMVVLLATTACQPYQGTGKERVVSQSAEFQIGRAPFVIQAKFNNLIINKQ